MSITFRLAKHRVSRIESIYSASAHQHYQQATEAPLNLIVSTCETYLFLFTFGAWVVCYEV